MSIWKERILAAATAGSEACKAAEEHEYAAAASSYASAAQILQTALHDAFIGQASAAAAIEDFSQAADAASAAERVSPSSALAMYWQGYVKFMTGKHDSAKNAFQKAVNFETDLALKSSYLDWVSRASEAHKNSKASSPSREAVASAPHGVIQPVEQGIFPLESQQSTSDVSVDDHPLPLDVRMEWYQSTQYVNLDIYAKNIDKAASSVELTECRLSARFIRPGKTDYVLDKQLFGRIMPQESGWSVSKFKAEIRLRKETAGEWKVLDAEGSHQSVVERARVTTAVTAPRQTNKNWDEITAKELDGSSEDAADPMAVFRSIYAKADDDARRAMMKSYMESGGKVLSTDWNDVKSRKVEYKDDERKI